MEVVRVRRLLVLLAVLVAGCTGGAGDGTLPSIGGTAGSSGPAPSAVATPTATGPFDTKYATDPRSPVTWLVTPTGSQRYDLALAAYRHWVIVVHRLGSTPDPADPELSVVAAGEARTFFARRLGDGLRTHTNQLGPTVVRSANVRLSGADVAVAACQDMTRAFVYVNGKKAAEAAGYYREVAVLREIAGRWTVIQANGDQRPSC